MSAAMHPPHPKPAGHPGGSDLGLAHRVALDLGRLRSSSKSLASDHPHQSPPSTIRVKRSVLQLQPAGNPPTTPITSRQLADQRLLQALGGPFDYIGARSMLHRLAQPTNPSVGVDQGGTLAESIMARVRSLAAATSQNAALALHERATQEAALRRSHTKPTSKTKPPPIPLSDLPPSMIPVPRPPITQFAPQPPPSPTPTATPTTRRGADRPERDKSPLRAPNKFYNVRVSQNPIFLRRTSIKPPHLASLPIPAPPLPAPPMATTTPVPRPRSPVRRAPKPPAVMTGSVRPTTTRSARTTSVALQTYLAETPPPPRVGSVPRVHCVATVGVQADADWLPTRDAKDAWTMTDPPALVDRATTASPVHGGRAVGCQADWVPSGPAMRAIASQTEQGVRGRTVALDTRDLGGRPAHVAIQTDQGQPVAMVHAQEEDWVGQAQAELVQWIEMQVLLRLVAEELVEDVAVGMVAELVQEVVARWPVAMGTQVDMPVALVEDGVQVVPEPMVFFDGATQVTPSVTPPRMVTPDVSAIAGVELGVQTSFASLPTISELGEEEEEEDLEVPLPMDQATQVSFHPIVSDKGAQVTHSPPSPSSSEEPTPTPRLLRVPPATPSTETSYHSIGIQRTRTPTPPPPEPSPPTPFLSPRVPTPGVSLPPPSSIHPSSPARTASPGLVAEPSATTIHTASATMSMDVSEGEVLTGMHSEGELLSGAIAVAPSAQAGLGMRQVSADTTAEEAGDSGHLVVHRHGHELDQALVWVKQQERQQRKRRAMQRMRLKGLSQRMMMAGSAEASGLDLEPSLTSGISLSDGMAQDRDGADVSLGEVVGATAHSESEGESGLSRDSGSEMATSSTSRQELSGAADDERGESPISNSTNSVHSQSEGEMLVDNSIAQESLGTSGLDESSVSGGGPLPPSVSGLSARRPVPFLSNVTPSS